MNPSPPPSAAADSAAHVNQSAPSSQSLPHQSPPPSLPSTTTPPLTKPSSAQSTVRPATDHHWYNKQVAAAPYPQPQSVSLNPPNPNPTNLQLQFPIQQGTTQGLVYPVGTSSGAAGAFAMKNSNTNNRIASRSANGGDRSAAHSLQQLGRPDTLSNQQMQFLKSGYLNPSHPALSGGGSTALHGFPVTSYPKVGFSVATDRIGNCEASQHRSKDDSLAVVLNRKVRVSEGSSIYSLCRSWLKNGVHDEYQPTRATRYSYLPRPLPTPAQTPSQKSSDTNDVEEEEDKEDEKDVELLSSEDLLQKHIKRAKRVRSRLREERLHRITRYKTRLAALLPSPVEPIREETPADN